MEMQTPVVVAVEVLTGAYDLDPLQQMALNVYLVQHSEHLAMVSRECRRDGRTHDLKCRRCPGQTFTFTTEPEAKS